MNYLACALIFAIAIGTIAARNTYDTTYRSPKPEHINKCVYYDVVVPFGGEGQPKGRCELFKCDEGFYGDISTCDVPEVEAPCKLGDFTKPDAAFPDCCERHVICPDDM